MALPLSACKGPISDTELQEILSALLPKDAELNGYIWGDAFTTAAPDSSEGVEDSRTPIYEAVSNSPYGSVEAFKADIESVYTEEICTIIFEYAFENSDSGMSRFCDDVDDEGKTVGIRMDVTNNHEPYKLTTTAYISSARVKRSTSTMMDAEIDVTYLRESGAVSDTIVINLLNVEGVWKINSQTWIINAEQ